MGDGVVDKYCSYNYRTFESPKEQYQATVCVCIWDSFHWSWSFSIWCLCRDSKPLFQHQSWKGTCNSTVAKCSNENGSLCFRDPVSWNQLVLCKQVNWCLEFQGREKDFITAHLGKLHNVAAKIHQKLSRNGYNIRVQKKKETKVTVAYKPKNVFVLYIVAK